MLHHTTLSKGCGPPRPVARSSAICCARRTISPRTAYSTCRTGVGGGARRARLGRFACGVGPHGAMLRPHGAHAVAAWGVWCRRSAHARAQRVCMAAPLPCTLETACMGIVPRCAATRATGSCRRRLACTMRGRMDVRLSMLPPLMVPFPCLLAWRAAGVCLRYLASPCARNGRANAQPKATCCKARGANCAAFTQLSHGMRLRLIRALLLAPLTYAVAPAGGRSDAVSARAHAPCSHLCDSSQGLAANASCGRSATTLTGVYAPLRMLAI